MKSIAISRTNLIMVYLGIATIGRVAIFLVDSGTPQFGIACGDVTLSAIGLCESLSPTTPNRCDDENPFHCCVRINPEVYASGWELLSP